MTTPERPPPAVLVVTFWPFRTGLIQAYTLPYVRMIARNIAPTGKVLMVTLEPAVGGLSPEGAASVAASLANDRIELIPLRYRKFGPAALLGMVVQIMRLWVICRDSDVRVIHAFCTPAGAIGWALSFLTSLPLVIDSYEPHAESMLENGSWRRWGVAYPLLHFFEVLQSRRASVVIAASPAMRDYALLRYGVSFSSFYSKPACVDLNHFKPRSKDPELLSKLGLTGKIVGVYAGKLGGIYLDSEVFTFFKAAKNHWGSAFKALLLTPHPFSELKRRAVAAGLDENDITVLSVPHERMPEHLALADFALTPVKPVPTKRYCTPIKDGEYWAMGIPVVITQGISDDSDIIANGRIGAVIRSLDDAGYAEAVATIAELLESASRETLQARIRETAIKYRSFSSAETVYRSIYHPAGSRPFSTPG